MIKFIIARCLDYEDKACSLSFERVCMCPRCGSGLLPLELAAVVFTPKNNNPDDLTVATILNYCPICEKCFISTYIAEEIPNREELKYKTVELVYSEPIKKIPKTDFSKYINQFSPKFVEIYNQTEQAEQTGLNELAGMGYRKALEFIVKDFAIKLNPDKKSDIESMLLSQYINTYINNPKIKTLAEKSAWLGNDETHYIKKHSDRDVSDLKNFINACVSYIDMELTVEDAGSIQHV